MSVDAPGAWLGDALEDMRGRVLEAAASVPMGQADSTANVAIRVRETVEGLLGCDCEVEVEDASSSHTVFLRVRPLVENVNIRLVVK